MPRLTITERFLAPVERVFGAWASAEQVGRWFALGDMHVPEAEVDPRPGGRYRIVMQETDGTRHIVTGENREVVPNERLAFTWQWEGRDVVTFVEVEFRAADGGSGTELELVHTQFDSDEWRDMHAQGWNGCLANLRADLAERG